MKHKGSFALATYIAVIVFTTAADRAGAADTYSVTNANDGGGGSLRQAILDANTAGGGTINMTPGGPINMLSALPPRSKPCYGIFLFFSRLLTGEIQFRNTQQTLCF